MVSVRTYTLLINVFVFYAVLSTLLGTVIALPIFILAVGSLFYFHIEPVDRDVADEVLLPNTKVEVIAHRGGSLDAPENTLEAFRLASKNGATGIELDVEFTKDGIPIIMHDGTVDRTTDGTGQVSSFTLAELKKLNAAGNFKHSGKFSHVKVPTLEEGISVCLSLGMKMFLDCKGFNSSKTADAIVNIFQKYPEMYQNAAVCSFNPRIILKVRRRDSGIVTGLTHRRHVIRTKTADSDEPRHAAKWKQYLSWPLDLLLEWSQNTWLWYLCGNSVFLAHIDQVSMNYVRAWRALGVRVLVWTVNQPAQKEMCARILECPYLTDTLTDATTKQHIKMR